MENHQNALGACYEEMLNDHWLHQFSWHGLDVDKVAKRHKCLANEVRAVMRGIEQKHPRKWLNVEFKRPCRTCGKVIGFSRTKSGKLMPVNLDDFTTHWACEKPGKRKFADD